MLLVLDVTGQELVQLLLHVDGVDLHVAMRLVIKSIRIASIKVDEACNFFRMTAADGA